MVIEISKMGIKGFVFFTVNNGRKESKSSATAAQARSPTTKTT